MAAFLDESDDLNDRPNRIRDHQPFIQHDVVRPDVGGTTAAVAAAAASEFDLPPLAVNHQFVDREAPAAAKNGTVKPQSSKARPAAPLTAGNMTWKSSGSVPEVTVQINNMLARYNVRVTVEDLLVDLDNTSCDDSDKEELHQRVVGARREKSARRFEASQSPSIPSNSSSTASVASNPMDPVDYDQVAHNYHGSAEDRAQRDAEERYRSAQRRARRTMSTRKRARRSTSSSHERPLVATGASQHSSASSRSLAWSSAAPTRLSTHSHSHGHDHSHGQSCGSSKRKSTEPARGERGKLVECFFCMWARDKSGRVQRPKMQTLEKLMFDGAGEVQLQMRARAAHLFYTYNIRIEAFASGIVLPKWRSKQVFMCILTHNNHPREALALRITDTTRVADMLARNISHYVEDENGKKREVPNFEVLRYFKDYIRLNMWLRLQDPRKMLFARDTNDEIGSREAFNSMRLLAGPLTSGVSGLGGRK